MDNSGIVDRYSITISIFFYFTNGWNLGWNKSRWFDKRFQMITFTY